MKLCPACLSKVYGSAGAVTCSNSSCGEWWDSEEQRRSVWNYVKEINGTLVYNHVNRKEG